MFEKNEKGITLASKIHQGSSKKNLRELISVEES